jgi:hypothetical protein
LVEDVGNPTRCVRGILDERGAVVGLQVAPQFRDRLVVNVLPTNPPEGVNHQRAGGVLGVNASGGVNITKNGRFENHRAIS